MNLYDVVMKPLEAYLLADIRKEIVPLAHGDVLELGIGTGANLPFYNTATVTSLTGFDKVFDKELEEKNHILGDRFHFVQGDMEVMPFAAESFDAIVATLVLCSVHPVASVQGILHALKPGGLFIFMEHICPTGRLGTLAKKINSAWSKLAQGCNLTRSTDTLLQESGFAHLDLRYAGSNIICYGIATKKS